MSEQDSWQEYKNLVIKELERNDENIQKVLDGVQNIGNEIAIIKTSIDVVKDDLSSRTERENKLETRIVGLEKDYSALKTRVIIIGGSIGTIVSFAITIILKTLL